MRKKSLNHAELAQLKSPRKITTTTIGSECTLPNPQKAALINAATPTRTAVIIMNCLSKKLIERRWKANRRLTKSHAQWPEGQWQMRCDRWRIEACTLYCIEMCCTQLFRLPKKWPTMPTMPQSWFCSITCTLTSARKKYTCQINKAV